MAQHGFKKIVVELIKKYPGLTAEEYAKMALDQGLCGSDSKNPVFSLATTLRKEYREGRMPSIRAEKIGGKLRFYPLNYPDNKQDKSHKPDVAITGVLSAEDSESIDALVEIGKFKNRSEALSWLVKEGIKTKQEELNQAKDILNKIRQLKNSLTITTELKDKRYWD